MNETAFWNKLREELPDGGHYTRVENLVGPGTPDVHYCVSSRSGWMEVKYTDKFPLEHPVLVSQMIWLEQHLRAGGRACICVGYKKLVYFVPADVCREINEWLQVDFQDRCTAIAIRGSRLDPVADAFIRTIGPQIARTGR